MRQNSLNRKTNETDISVILLIEGKGKSKIKTGIGFLDHMIDQLAKHSLIDIELLAKGDLHVDYHHTTEDSAIVLGQAFKNAIGDMKGIMRFGQALSAMDETHHIIESCFKGLARCLRQATRIDTDRREEIPSTKGTLRESL